MFETMTETQDAKTEGRPAAIADRASAPTAHGEVLRSEAGGSREAADYDLVRRAIERISLDYREQPSLAELARRLEVDEEGLVTLFRRWCGLTPKSFLQAVTLDHARRLLSDGLPLLDAAFEVGLSGPSRLHDLFVKHEALSPGAYKAKGEGLSLVYGFHETPFGLAIVTASERGLAGIGFAEDGEEGRAAALADMRRRWPRAAFREDQSLTAPYRKRVFEPGAWRAETPLRVVLIGTDFEVRVWEALSEIPFGTATTYSAIAARIGAPKAARAVGAAVGRNPISFVVPCHRVVGRTGALTGYHWGLTRKRAMLGWESGVLARE
ncbi:methylated-DNA--[protein]-cysteine S-methyltransferase [Fulvimarina endophytica]|uniref:methylated-DNA--[protein]-cysteine S-methyltransferase n=1 Tax=Fulvimarina endophytica TaxID=2293836 RepID=A0A371X4D5_9HYPH|nr:bifunctional helix-turn-helix domain-containing protein/methylated-DNA--[protein]-cysteine S-methyltransferase [Fulvimarina endophytica]RFC64067.1 methylated-DNA--[protein]-cysteine S-methyltransferase [Fulvimarina endophytica]